MGSEIDIDDITVDAISFSFIWAVDSAIRSESETASNLGASPAHSFGSVVDSAIRSSSASEADLGTSPMWVLPLPSQSSPHAWSENETPVSMFKESSYLPTVLNHVDDKKRTVSRLFTLTELKAATNNFSLHNKIFGVGSIGDVYRGKLFDGREVAIKRAETTWSSRSKSKEFQEMEIFTFALRLHHKHLVGLVGFCREEGERLTLYEYMKNGALSDHLHDKNNVDKGSSVLNCWKMRIKIALDASRGIEYLHNNYERIHRNIKSSNILLDATWTARVSDFESSSICPKINHDIVLGTLGYLDPEYLCTSLFKAKSDEYGLGVVLLELLTGKPTIFNYGKHGSTNMVNFARRAILAGEMLKILDPRVGPPGVNEAKALELVAYTAIQSIDLQRKNRLTMAHIMVNLESALAICDS